MSETFDVIIIGAGIGGLSAAARLCREGLKVAVLERNPHPGGTAYVYFRKGFAFPMGPLGFSSPRLVHELLSELDININPGLKRVHYRLRAFGLDLPLSLPFEEIIAAMAKASPADEKAINDFFAQVQDIAGAMQDPEQESNREILEKAAATPARKFLRDLISDPRLLRVMGSIGTSEPYSSLALLASMWSLMCDQGIWYPEGGTRSICDRLARLVTDCGGELRYGVEALHINTQGEKVTGVTLKGGDQLNAAYVVSNADYKATFINLMDPDSAPQEFFRAVFKARQTGSNIQVCLGLDASKVGLELFSEATRIIYRRSAKDDIELFPPPDWAAAEVLPEDLAGQELELCLWSADDPSLAPEGKAVLVIRTEAEYTHFTRYRPLRGKRLPAYQDYKHRLGMGLVKEAENLVPGLSEAVLVMDVATPLTFEERGGRSGGAVAGWSWDYEDSRDFLPRELVATPFAGLYMAGYQALSSLFLGGVPTALVSGKLAARAVLENAPPAASILMP